MIWPFHGRASEPTAVPPKNIKETNRVMRSLGFADNECGEYVAKLRRFVAESLEKDGQFDPAFKLHIAPNINNENRARIILDWNRP